MVHGPATIARVGAILATNPRLIAAPSSPNLAMKELTWIRTDGHDRAERQPQHGGDPQEHAAARCAERAPRRAPHAAGRGGPSPRAPAAGGPPHQRAGCARSRGAAGADECTRPVARLSTRSIPTGQAAAEGTS